jgi:hypothetical protein
MHDASTTTEAYGTGSAAGGLMLGLLGALALAGLVLGSGHGMAAAFLAYSLGGASARVAATLGRAALAPLSPARVRRRTPAQAASTFA